MFPILIYYRR